MTSIGYREMPSGSSTTSLVTGTPLLIAAARTTQDISSDSTASLVTGAPPLLLAPFSADRQRLEEHWTKTSQALLVRWVDSWESLATAHTMAARKKRCMHHSLSIPVTIIPLVITLFTSKSFIEDSNIVVVIGLSFVVVLNTINTIMRYDAMSQKHDNAAFRFQDLITDVEEVLSKQVADRPDPDIFVFSVKTRSDFIGRLAPDVVVPKDTPPDNDSEDEEI